MFCTEPIDFAERQAEKDKNGLLNVDLGGMKKTKDLQFG
jgi:hypothetical protein